MISGCPRNDGRKPSPKLSDLKNPKTPPLDQHTTPKPTTRPVTSDLSTRERFAKALGVPLYPRSTLVPKGSRLSAGDVNLVLSSNDAVEHIVGFYEKMLKRKAVLTELPSGIRYSFPVQRGQAVLITPTPDVLQAEVGGKVMITIYKRGL